MTLKCTNNYCGYGPQWDEGDEVARDPQGRVTESLRADAYSQEGNFNGLCLNCLDDFERDREMMETEARLDLMEIVG